MRQVARANTIGAPHVEFIPTIMVRHGSFLLSQLSTKGARALLQSKRATLLVLALSTVGIGACTDTGEHLGSGEPSPVMGGGTAPDPGTPAPSQSPSSVASDGGNAPVHAVDSMRPDAASALDAAPASGPSAPPTSSGDTGAPTTTSDAKDAGGSPDPFPDGQHTGGPIAAAWAALKRGDVAAMTRALGDLDDLAAREPDNGYAHFYAAIFRYQQLAEGQNLNGVLGTATMLSEFERARQLEPNDFRIPGFYGNAQVVTGDTAGGAKTLQAAIDMFPAYGYFLRATATSVLDPADPLFATTVSDMDAMAKACRFTPSAGDIAYRYPSTSESDRVARVCLNKGLVPHSWEGLFISFGDMVLKAGGDVERARALYRSAQTSPSYDTWPFASLLEERIATAEARRAQYADLNPLNDPPVWALDGHICRGCHQER